jgi:SAM-dependent methyltransferase
MKQNIKAYQDINSETIDRWAKSGWIWGIPITSQEFKEAKNGNWGIVLTPTKIVPKSWFVPYLKQNSLQGVKVLGLASGGGQQMAIMAALGAEVTLLDNSQVQIDSDILVAKRENYKIKTLKADMTKPWELESESFDIIVHPVSNCYIEKVQSVWDECFRVLKPNGILIAGFDSGFNYLFDDVKEGDPLVVQYEVPFNPLISEVHKEVCERLDSGMQFSHDLEENINGQIQSGLTITNLLVDQDKNDIFGKYYPCFYLTRSIKLK